MGTFDPYVVHGAYNSLMTISGVQNWVLGNVISSVPHCSGSQLMNSFFHTLNNKHQADWRYYFKRWISIQYELVFFNRNIQIRTMVISFICFLYSQCVAKYMLSRVELFHPEKKSNCRWSVSIFSSQLYAKFESLATKV